jgi:hypothetical protein
MLPQSSFRTPFHCSYRARAKINNAVVTIDESHETESLIMRKHLIVALLLTIATGLITGVLVNLGI